MPPTALTWFVLPLAATNAIFGDPCVVRLRRALGFVFCVVSQHALQVSAAGTRSGAWQACACPACRVVPRFWRSGGPVLDAWVWRVTRAIRAGCGGGRGGLLSAVQPVHPNPVATFMLRQQPALVAAFVEGCRCLHSAVAAPVGVLLGLVPLRAAFHFLCFHPLACCLVSVLERGRPPGIRCPLPYKSI